jgi:hypothetical protein
MSTDESAPLDESEFVMGKSSQHHHNHLVRRNWAQISEKGNLTRQLTLLERVLLFQTTLTRRTTAPLIVRDSSEICHPDQVHTSGRETNKNINEVFEFKEEGEVNEIDWLRWIEGAVVNKLVNSIHLIRERKRFKDKHDIQNHRLTRAKYQCRLRSPSGTIRRSTLT